MPLTFAKSHLALAEQYLFWTLHFAKRQALAVLVTSHMSPENIENPQVLVEMKMLLG